MRKDGAQAYGKMKPVHHRLALDNNLLSRQSSRQLLHGVALALDLPLIVLPEVLTEALDGVQSVQEGFAVKALERSNLADDAKERCVRAAGKAARKWLTDELARPDNAFQGVNLTLSQAWAARRIAANLPRRAVKRRNPDEIGGDPLIIGEAAVTQVSLLSTNNMETIEHDETNAWAKSTLGLNTPLIHTPDETIRALSLGDRGRALEWCLAFGGVVAPEQGDDDALWESLERAAMRLQGAGFVETARRMNWDLDASRDARKVASSALATHSEVANQAVASERRRRQVVETAIGEAADSPSP